MAELNKEQFKRLFKQFLTNNNLSVVIPKSETERTPYITTSTTRECNMERMIEMLWNELIGKGYG